MGQTIANWDGRLKYSKNQKTKGHASELPVTSSVLLKALNATCGLQLEALDQSDDQPHSTANQIIHCPRRNKEVGVATIGFWSGGITPHSYEWHHLQHHNQVTILANGTNEDSLQLITAACRAFREKKNQPLIFLKWGAQEVRGTIHSNTDPIWIDFWRKFPSLLQIVASNQLRLIRSHYGDVYHLSSDGVRIHMQASIPHSENLVRQIAKKLWGSSVPGHSAMQQISPSQWILHSLFSVNWQYIYNPDRGKISTFIILPSTLWSKTDDQSLKDAG